MQHSSSGLRFAFATAASAALVALSACDSERQAEADTPVSEAEVSTELPESVVSDEQLDIAANAAAEMAATPPPEIVPMPVPAPGGGAGATGAAGQQQGNAAAGGTSTEGAANTNRPQ